MSLMEPKMCQVCEKRPAAIWLEGWCLTCAIGRSKPSDLPEARKEVLHETKRQSEED